MRYLLTALLVFFLFDISASDVISGSPANSQIKETIAYRSGRVRQQEPEAGDKEVITKAISRKVPEEWFVAGEALTIIIPADSSSVLNGAYPIDAEGYADLPILGRVFVTDKNRKELQEFLKAQLAHYMKDTHITARPAIRISFVGGFQEPGMHYIHPDMVVWDAFLFPKGIVLQKDIEEMVEKMAVMRGSQILDMRPLDLFSSGLTLREAGILSGDIFFMPIPEEKLGFWHYFKESLTIVSSMVAITASLTTTYLIWYQMNNPDAVYRR